jgi:crossover junction endodeoxyribonuclease RuvC
MKILGIDPGSIITGFGVIDVDKLKFNYITSGSIKTKGDFVNRIAIIFLEIQKIIIKHNPDVVVIERIFMRPDRPNPESSIKLGHARGAIISAAAINNFKIIEYSPNQIKKTLVGKGHASKDQVVFMVCKTLKLNKNPQTDAADALAGAICHAYHCI